MICTVLRNAKVEVLIPVEAHDHKKIGLVMYSKEHQFLYTGGNDGSLLKWEYKNSKLRCLDKLVNRKDKSLATFTVLEDFDLMFLIFEKHKYITCARVEDGSV